MYGSSITPYSGAGASTFAPFADNASAATPPKAPDAIGLPTERPSLKDSAGLFADASTVSQTPETTDLAARAPLPGEAVGQARGKREASTVKFTIEYADGPLSELLKNDRVRRELDKAVDAAKGMDITEIEVKGYFPFFSEFGKMRADAVKNFLEYRGLDESVITAIGRGPGYASKHAPLAKTRAVVIEITGTPKQDAANAGSAPTAGNAASTAGSAAPIAGNATPTAGSVPTEKRVAYLLA